MRKRRSYQLKALFLFFILGGISKTCHTQETSKYLSELKATIAGLDSAFWTTYNSCDIETMQKFFSSDFEFYHDKEGLIKSRSSMIRNIKEGLCNDPEKRLRREALLGSVNIFSIDGYGALIEGEHYFYFKDGGQSEVLVERARFNHIWERRESDWVMTRVLSFDHQPIKGQEAIASVNIDLETLNSYQGLYDAPNSGKLKVSVDGHLLIITTQNAALSIKAVSETVFYSEETKLKFEFVKDKAGVVSKFIVYEKGELVEEATKVK